MACHPKGIYTWIIHEATYDTLSKYTFTVGYLKSDVFDRLSFVVQYHYGRLLIVGITSDCYGVPHQGEVTDHEVIDGSQPIATSPLGYRLFMDRKCYKGGCTYRTKLASPPSLCMVTHKG